MADFIMDGMGDNHPPKNIKAASMETKIIFAYSALIFGGLSAHCAIVYGDFTCGVLYFQAVPQYMAFCEHQRVYAYYWCLSGAYSCECYHS